MIDYVAIFVAGLCVGVWFVDWLDDRYYAPKVIKAVIQLQELTITMTTLNKGQQQKFFLMCRGFAERENCEFVDARPNDRPKG